MYYRMDWKFDYAGANLQQMVLRETPETDVPWTMGARYPKPVREPIEFYIEPFSGSVMQDMFAELPLFSQRFIDVLKSAGVRNMDIYDARVIDKVNDRVYTNYKAVNIIGKLSCADMEKSAYLPGFKPPMMEFTRLVIDESRTMGLPLFRLAESTQFILVSEPVKQAIEAANLLGVRVVSLDDRSAY